MTFLFTFLASTVGRYVIIGAIVLAAVVGIRQSGVNSERRKCEAAAKQRSLEIMQRDIRIGELLAKEDARVSAEQSKTEEIDREVQTKLEAELAKRPVAAQCRLSPDDAKRLR